MNKFCSTLILFFSCYFISFATTTACPVDAGILSGNQYICNSNSKTTTLTSTVSGGTWSSSNPSIATVNASGVVTSDWTNYGNVTITYSVGGSGGCKLFKATRTIYVANTEAGNLGLISYNGTKYSNTPTTPLTFCKGSTSLNFSIPGIPNVSGYVWRVDPGKGWTIKQSSDGLSAVVIFASNAVSANIEVYASNGCSAKGYSSYIWLTLSSDEAATFTAKPSELTCANTNVTYETLPGKSNYKWSVPGVLGTDYTIISGGISAASNIVTLKWLSSGSKNVTVNYDNACSPATNTTEVAISKVSAPSATPTLELSKSLTSIIHTTTGITGIQNNGVAGKNGLPAGVAASWLANKITISGTPTISGIFNYSIPLTGSCESLNATGTITVTALTTTWDGKVWSNGLPTTAKDVIFTGDAILENNVAANSLKVTAKSSVSVNSGYNITLSGSLTVESGSSFILNNNANLIQTDNAINFGNIIVTRDASPLKRLDYTLWSSPLTSSQTMIDFSPLTSTGRFYDYNSTANIFSPVVNNSTFSVGKGFLIRMPNTDPLPGYFAGTSTLIFSGQFIGVPNNGNVSIPGTAGQYVAVGNPYPSTLNADAFINSNTNSGGGGTLYFWRKTNNANQSTSPTTSYATYTLAGGVGTVGNGGFTPTVNIAVGQGFITVVPSSNTIVFTNAMRTASNSAKFLKTKQLEKSRIWLNLLEGEATLNQMMIAYMDGATSQVDAGIDGKYINDSATALTSNIDGDDYVIQGRALPFDTSDRVALNFKTASTGTFTIAKDHADGLFEDQEIYLVDAKTGNETNLQTDVYTFSATAGTDNERFSLKYQKTLGVKDMTTSNTSVKVYKNNSVLHVTSVDDTIDSVKVYDLQGRLVAEQKNVNITTANIINLKASNQTLIVKVTTLNNLVVTKKIIF